MTNMQGQGTQMGFNFKQKFLETQNLAIVSVRRWISTFSLTMFNFFFFFFLKQIENELNKIELSSYKKYSSNLLSFFPDNFTKQSGKNKQQTKTNIHRL